MANVIKTVIAFRRGTTAEWLANKDVIPVAGEPCYDLDLHTLKVGDGVLTYEKLPIIGGGEDVAVSADGKSIVLTDGIFSLAGFDAAEVGAQPRKNADGEIEWIVPSTETVDGLQTTIAGLQSDVEAIQDILTPTDENEEGLVDRVNTLETKMDGTGEGSVDAKINTKINEFADKISSDGTINTFRELVDYVAKHDGEAVDMASDIAELQTLVGETPVSEQIAVAISGKVDAESGKSLVDDTLIAKLKEIEENAQANKIESISAGGTILEGVNKNVDIPIASASKLGLVKGSTEIIVTSDGALEVVSISLDKVVQDENTVLIMDGGDAGT